MILDAFKVNSVALQINYPDAFAVWDVAGAIANAVIRIWPGVALDESKPNEQTFRSDSCALSTGLQQSVIQLAAGKGFDSQTIDRIAETMTVWQSMLGLSVLKRVSCRTRYVKEFPSKQAANAELLSWDLCRIPTERVFNQPAGMDAPRVEIQWIFDDPTSFTHVRVGIEEVTIEVKAHPEFPEMKLKKTKCRLYIDFDSGSLGEIKLDGFRITEWLKGHQHILRRDIDKVLQAHPSV